LAGSWTETSPIGYNNFRNANGKSTLIKNEKSELVSEAFKEIAKNQKPSDQLRKDMNKSRLKLSKQGFLDMLRNVAYTGKIHIVEFKKIYTGFDISRKTILF